MAMRLLGGWLRRALAKHRQASVLAFHFDQELVGLELAESGANVRFAVRRAELPEEAPQRVGGIAVEQELSGEPGEPPRGDRRARTTVLDVDVAAVGDRRIQTRERAGRGVARL